MRDTTRLTTAATAVDPSQISEIQYALSLTPRQLPAWLLYDDLGTALFEAICHLPWYGVTRVERQLLSRHAASIVEAAGRPTRLVELGAGSGDKLATFIDAGWPLRPPLVAELVDVSSGALQASRLRLAALEHVELKTWPLSYEPGLQEVARSADADRRTLVLFLGSNLGNFDPPDAELFLRQVRAVLGAGDALLIGTDLVKDARTLQLAYDDPLGVTAAFNRNLLVRLNRDLHANFDLARFVHEARWDAEASRVEMHLVSLARQDIRIPDAELAFSLEKGESIWTERSYKYEAPEVMRRLADAGFAPTAQWCDTAAGFALTLAHADD